MSQTSKINVAAIQMCATLADINKNLLDAERLICSAAKEGALWIVLPEFFTTACAFHPKMDQAAVPIDGVVTQLFKKLSKGLGVVIGGSFIADHGEDVFNTFVLVFPNGKIYQHNKDMPTMWEGCYYIGGTDDGILTTEAGRIGIALCWEMLRTQTAKRLLNNVQIVLSGSCWWDLPKSAPANFDSLRKKSLELLQETPVSFAKLLGVPVVHAAHAGEFEGFAAPSERKKYTSHYLGETQIVNRQGEVIEKMNRDQGEGYVIAEIEITETCEPSMDIPERFWIPIMPEAFLAEWDKLNLHAHDYYYAKKEH